MRKQITPLTDASHSLDSIFLTSFIHLFLSMRFTSSSVNSWMQSFRCSSLMHLDQHKQRFLQSFVFSCNRRKDASNKYGFYFLLHISFDALTFFFVTTGSRNHKHVFLMLASFPSSNSSPVAGHLRKQQVETENQLIIAFSLLTHFPAHPQEMLFVLQILIFDFSSWSECFRAEPGRSGCVLFEAICWCGMKADSSCVTAISREAGSQRFLLGHLALWTVIGSLIFRRSHQCQEQRI